MRGAFGFTGLGAAEAVGLDAAEVAGAATFFATAGVFGAVPSLGTDKVAGAAVGSGVLPVTVECILFPDSASLTRASAIDTAVVTAPAVPAATAATLLAGADGAAFGVSEAVVGADTAGADLLTSAGESAPAGLVTVAGLESTGFKPAGALGCLVAPAPGLPVFGAAAVVEAGAVDGFWTGATGLAAAWLGAAGLAGAGLG